MARTIVIVGGVAGGASAAARLRRLDEEAEIILLERDGYISFANCGLPYYLGGVIPKREHLLLQTPESMAKRFRIDVRIQSEVTAVDAAAKRVTVRDRMDGTTYDLPYDELVLSPGARPVKPPVPGADLPGVFTLRNMEDCDAIKQWIGTAKPRRALIVGAGFIGLEMMENLAHAGIQTVVVEMAPQVLTPLDGEMAAILHRHIKEKGLDLRLNTGLEAIEKDPSGGLVCRLTGGVTVAADMALVSVGVRPDNALAVAAGLELGLNGSIKVDEGMRTSDPHIYAVGDAISVTDFVTGKEAVVPLAGPANRQGRIVANKLAGRQGRYTGTQGTLACKVFEYTAGATGNNERQLRQAGMAYEKVYLHPGSHAGYYPGAETISMKLLFSPENGKILGAQAVGKSGVDKRIDVLATAIRAKMTVHDLEELELSYAPPFSSAKDPVNMAGFIAANVLKKDFRQLFVDEIPGLNPAKDFLVDVRTLKEFNAGTIPGAAHIPLHELRGRLGEFPKDKRIVVFCQVGLRGYVANRILTQRGFADTVNLSGGYQSWEQVYGG